MKARVVRCWGTALLGLALVLAQAGCGGPVASPSQTPSPTSGRATPSPTLATDWTGYHRDAGRSGVGPAVPALSSPQGAWTTNLDGYAYASPLIVAGHVLVATENNTVYSFDLFSGSVVWQMHLGDPVDAASLPCGNITPATGITGTPVADPGAGRLYVVAFLRAHHHMLFTLSLADGSIVAQRDVDPPGSNPTVQQQRGALALGSGFLYVPLGGLYGDCGAYHGYLEAVPVGGGAILTYEVPDSREAGIWTPAGATMDASGSVYVVTGNGESRSFSYANSVVKLSPDLHVQSYFTPANWAALNAGDTDLGSVGATLLPSLGVVIAIGKDGVAYLLNSDLLGGIGGQVARKAVCSAAFGGTAWSGTTVFVPCSDGLYALSVTSTSINILWSSPHPTFGSPIVAAGAVWAIEPSSAHLYALDPATGSVLYSAGLGFAAQFSTPAATEGYVVVPAGPHAIAFSTGG